MRYSTWLLIISALDENIILSSIFYEFGEICDVKIFLDILEMKYSEKANEDKDRTLVENLQKCANIAEIKDMEEFIATDESKKVNNLFEVDMMNPTTRVVDDKYKSAITTKFDDGYLFYENELQVFFEKNLIGKLLFALEEVNDLPIIVEAVEKHNDSIITIEETKET